MVTFSEWGQHFHGRNVVEVFCKCQVKNRGLLPTLNVKALNQDSSLAVSKVLIEKPQETEVETDETNAQDDLLIADFQRG